MSDAEKKVLEMRKAMADMREDYYAIVNEDFLRLDDFKQNLYLKVLCTLIQYENEPSAMQLLFFARLLKGAEKEEPVEDYMRQALDLSADNIRDFVQFIREDICRYYFALEAIMLVTMEKASRGRYEYLAEILELIGITKPEVDYLSSVAKSVLMQDTSYLNKAHLEIWPKLSENIKKVSSLPYHYIGVCIEDNDEILSISAPSIINYNIDNSILKNKKKIILKNLNVNLTCNLVFDGCEEVELQDCVILGGEFTMSFFKVKSLNISNCVFQDFIMLPFYAVDDIKICFNTFERCKFVPKSDLNLDDSEVALRVAGLLTVKGIIVEDSRWPYRVDMYANFGNSLSIENNEFSHCVCDSFDDKNLLSSYEVFNVAIRNNVFINAKDNSGNLLLLSLDSEHFEEFLYGVKYITRPRSRSMFHYKHSKEYLHIEGNSCVSSRSGASRRLDC